MQQKINANIKSLKTLDIEYVAVGKMTKYKNIKENNKQKHGSVSNKVPGA